MPAPADFGIVGRPVRRIDAGGAWAAAAPDSVVVEEPLEIRVGAETLAVTMRTPGDDAHLALGFLLAEGLIRARADVAEIRALDGPGGLANAIEVIPRAGVATLDPAALAPSRRGTLTTAACGVCGRKTVADLLARAGKVAPGPVVAREVLAASPDALRRAQSIFAETGAIHAAAALTSRGEVLAAAEDVGRHNAVDKVVGALLEAGAIGAAGERAPAILVVSGRVSFEIIQKAAVAGIPIVAGVSAPTSLAIDLAEACAITLAGFVRAGRMNVYTGEARVSGS